MSDIITSRKNDIVTLSRGLMKEKKIRYKENLFIIEGFRICEDALKSGVRPEKILFSVSAAKRLEKFYKKIAENYQITIISDSVAEYISDTKTTQGVFLIISLSNVLDKKINLDTICSSNKFRLILLDGLADSGNVGNIIRTADALMIDAVVLSNDSVDITSPKVIRSTMGSIFRVPIEICDLCDFIDKIKKRNVCVYSSILDENAKKLREFEFPPKSAVIIGNEGNGIREEVLKKSDEKIYIPIKNVESLNAATAASVLMWELSNI